MFLKLRIARSMPVQAITLNSKARLSSLCAAFIGSFVSVLACLSFAKLTSIDGKTETYLDNRLFSKTTLNTLVV